MTHWKRKYRDVQASGEARVIALAPDHEAWPQGVAVGTRKGAFILIRYFRSTDTGLGQQVKERKGEGKWTRGGKCGGTERVEGLSEKWKKRGNS